MADVMILVPHLPLGATLRVAPSLTAFDTGGGKTLATARTHMGISSLLALTTQAILIAILENHYDI